MVKTNVPSEFKFGNNTIATNALPDPFDALDLLYRPKLQLLPPVLDGRAGKVLDQKGKSCTGHAVAALIDTVNSLPLANEPHERPAPTSDDQAQLPVHALRAGPPVRRVPRQRRRRVVASRRVQGLVPPRRLHGEDLGLHHLPGTRPRRPGFIAECMRTPLGAYYRVNVRRIDDMQSALTRAERDRGVGRDPRGLADARARCTTARRSGSSAAPRAASPSRSGGHAFLHRRLQRRRLPRPELVGHDVGPQRLRDAALRRLARQRLRRLGRPARRPAGRHRPPAAQGDPRRWRLRRRRRHGPRPAASRTWST